MEEIMALGKSKPGLSDRVIKNTEIKLYSKREREFFLSSPIQLKLNQTNK